MVRKRQNLQHYYKHNKIKKRQFNLFIHSKFSHVFSWLTPWTGGTNFWESFPPKTLSFDLVQLYSPFPIKETEVAFNMAQQNVFSNDSDFHCSCLIPQQRAEFVSAVLYCPPVSLTEGGNSTLLLLECCVAHVLHEHTHASRHVGVYGVLTSNEHADTSYYWNLKLQVKKKILSLQS